LVPYAGISKETFKKFNSYTKCVGPDQDPVEIGFPYGNDVYQVRFLYDKLDRNGKIQKYTSRGITSDAKLFGQDVFDAGSSKAVTVCEGAKDACSVYEINGDFPVVAVRGASTAKNSNISTRSKRSSSVLTTMLQGRTRRSRSPLCSNSTRYSSYTWILETTSTNIFKQVNRKLSSDCGGMPSGIYLTVSRRTSGISENCLILKKTNLLSRTLGKLFRR
jgi:hypothetical protein